MELPGSLEGRVALVFGAGSSRSGVSNGMASSVAYAREGAVVVAVDIDRDAASVTAEAIMAEAGQCVVIQGDVRHEADIVQAVATAADRFGQIDILHNNVGVLRLGGPELLSTDDWDTSLDANLRSVFLACKHTLPVMTRQKKGAIVNMSSIAGWRWSGRAMSGYSASKAGINQLTRELAVEYAPHGIRANAIVPGLINTPMVVEPYKKIYGDAEAMILERDSICPSGKMGTPWDVANAAVFLASDRASYISGVLLAVDGALSCKAF